MTLPIPTSGTAAPPLQMPHPLQHQLLPGHHAHVNRCPVPRALLAHQHVCTRVRGGQWPCACTRVRVVTRRDENPAWSPCTPFTVPASPAHPPPAPRLQCPRHLQSLPAPVLTVPSSPGILSRLVCLGQHGCLSPEAAPARARSERTCVHGHTHTCKHARTHVHKHPPP